MITTDLTYYKHILQPLCAKVFSFPPSVYIIYIYIWRRKQTLTAITTTYNPLNCSKKCKKTRLGVRTHLDNETSVAQTYVHGVSVRKRHMVGWKSARGRCNSSAPGRDRNRFAVNAVIGDKVDTFYFATWPRRRRNRVCRVYTIRARGDGAVCAKQCAVPSTFDFDK